MIVKWESNALALALQMEDPGECSLSSPIFRNHLIIHLWLNLFCLSLGWTKRRFVFAEARAGINVLIITCGYTSANIHIHTQVNEYSMLTCNLPPSINPFQYFARSSMRCKLDLVIEGGLICIQNNLTQEMEEAVRFAGTDPFGPSGSDPPSLGYLHFSKCKKQNNCIYFRVGIDTCGSNIIRNQIWFRIQ